MNCAMKWWLAQGGVAVAAALAAVAPSARADALTTGNILVSTGAFFTSHPRQVIEFTPIGTMVQFFNVPVPTGGGPTDQVRDLVVGGDGRVYIYNGTFSPTLTVLSPETGAFIQTQGVGFSTINNGSYGGIGTFGNYVFVTDQTTGGSLANGIVRFNVTDFSSERFASQAFGAGFSDLTVGLDGLLYGFNPPGGGPASQINVYDPESLAQVRTINLDSTAFLADLRGIAVDGDGTIYAAGWDGRVYRISNSGMVLGSRATGAFNLTDIDIAPDGRLVLGGRFGDVILTDTAFAALSRFGLEPGFPIGPSIFVAFTDRPGPAQVIPEPASLTLLGLGALGLAAFAHRRTRAARPGYGVKENGISSYLY